MRTADGQSNTVDPATGRPIGMYYAPITLMIVMMLMLMLMLTVIAMVIVMVVRIVIRMVLRIFIVRLAINV